MRNKDEVLHVDRIVAMSEQLKGFILKEIIDSKDKLYHNGHPSYRHREGPRTCSRDKLIACYNNFQCL
jgi:hypothetical protein